MIRSKAYLGRMKYPAGTELEPKFETDGKKKCHYKGVQRAEGGAIFLNILYTFTDLFLRFRPFCPGGRSN